MFNAKGVIVYLFDMQRSNNNFSIIIVQWCTTPQRQIKCTPFPSKSIFLRTLDSPQKCGEMRGNSTKRVCDETKCGGNVAILFLKPTNSNIHDNKKSHL